ncbi:MAG TPA: hypothetical protein VFN67_05415 [Polyangiales bacterium]|nr:hypothetical protein [Polyangiales bacterium]
MLSALLRNASVTALMLLTACQFSSAPNIGQSAGSKKKGDAGSEEGSKRRVVVAKPTPETDAAADAQIDASEEEPAKAGAGGKAGSKSTAGSGGSPAKTDGGKKPADKEPSKPADDKKPEDKDNNPAPPADKPVDSMDAGKPDAAAQGPLADGGLDAGPRPMVDNPIGVLEGLASRSPGGRTATTINRFLETIAKGDAPAASIKEFLVTINDEMMCEMNPFATECLAACQAVSTTCWVCVLDEPCRTSLLDICGYSALAGCVPRR